MELVNAIRAPKHVNPLMSIIYSSPKSGKTTIVSQLEDHLILELEPGGADFVSARVQDIFKPSEFNDVLKVIEDSPTKVATYLVIDTCTKLDEWSEIVGTYTYMSKPQGKKFNRVGEVADGVKILHTDGRFETVHTIGQGFGYQFSRQVMTDWYDRLLNLITIGKVNHIILLAHVKDKLVESKNGDSVDSIDINLTGKVKSIYASRVDAIGHLYREGSFGYLSFDNEYKVVCGGRCKHLDGVMKISEKMPDKSIKTFWENIFIKE